MLVVVGVGVVYCEGQRVVWVGAVDRHERVRWRAVLLLLAGRSPTLPFVNPVAAKGDQPTLVRRARIISCDRPGRMVRSNLHERAAKRPSQVPPRAEPFARGFIRR